MFGHTFCTLFTTNTPKIAFSGHLGTLILEILLCAQPWWTLSETLGMRKSHETSLRYTGVVVTIESQPPFVNSEGHTAENLRKYSYYY